jgi:hypothetical protein
LIQMHFELTTYNFDKVASLAAGIGVDFLHVLPLGHLYALPINLFAGEHGIAAVDRLYPLKPKSPI